MSLHNRIMNIPANNSHSQSYKAGHRDARHAAAEMSLEYEEEIERLRARLAEMEGQEPSYYIHKEDGIDFANKHGRAMVALPTKPDKYYCVPLYTAPPAVPTIQSPELALLVREVMRANPSAKETHLSMVIAIAVSEALRAAAPQREGGAE